MKVKEILAELKAGAKLRLWYGLSTNQNWSLIRVGKEPVDLDTRSAAAASKHCVNRLVQPTGPTAERYYWLPNRPHPQPQPPGEHEHSAPSGETKP